MKLLKKHCPQALLALQELFGKGRRLRYLCQDESRVGLKTEPQRIITIRGVQPIVDVGWKRLYFWLYGVVEPLTGWQLCQEFPHLNALHFQEFVDTVSSQLGEDIAILQIDSSAAHQSYNIKWPDNIIPICQPPYSPQLNPIERFWQFVKSQLKGCLFHTLDELRFEIDRILNQITPERVISLTSYNFILEALFYATSL